jgi:sec-independent protein translocase protein TatA
MFGMGGLEIGLIVLVILVLFGPKQIPEIAKTINSGMTQLRKAQEGFHNQLTNIKNEMDESLRDEEEKHRNQIQSKGKNNA